jgi:DNA polymerase-3 subunit beta
LPKITNKKIVVNRDAFLHALKRVVILADEKSKMVKFAVQNDLMTLVSDNSELGEAREHIEIAFKGESITIGLNAKYVIDILSAMDTKKINFRLKDAESSCLITPADNEDYKCIVMPMRI